MAKVKTQKSTVAITGATRVRLKRLGSKGETYDDILNRLAEHVETCEKYFEELSESSKPTPAWFKSRRVQTN